MDRAQAAARTTGRRPDFAPKVPPQRLLSRNRPIGGGHTPEKSRRGVARREAALSTSKSAEQVEAKAGEAGSDGGQPTERRGASRVECQSVRGANANAQSSAPDNEGDPEDASATIAEGHSVTIVRGSLTPANANRNDAGGGVGVVSRIRGSVEEGGRTDRRRDIRL